MMRGQNKGAIYTANRIPKDSVGVEIGVWKGDSSMRFLRKAKHLHMVDPWSMKAYGDAEEFGGMAKFLKRYQRIVGTTDPRKFQEHYEAVYQQVRNRFADQPVTIHRCTSEKFFARFAEKVDWVYVDGAHTFEGCLADLRGAKSITRPGGFIFGDDYGNKPGVTRAVDTFLRETGLPVHFYGWNQYQVTNG